ncbi:hypothetical protein CONLIGDRAFT_672670 [Coniochaeta ligniaria NRRL 30616]|uniref:Uncharacterized protein n=1 Tax=Coniochaeta ligniaria NRRL 30616 TaxID=1408157 RepID=A0A1J7JDP5_9PEZI|nr:hypothetical protein CONLIGDRAFT_672670 [Coniochaeta ligniaria NRRL 30616]
MCRLVVFTGACPRCSGEFTWDELSQELSCLEAKNVGRFGECRRGVNYEYHAFDQECPACAAELEEDEGVDVDVFEPPAVVDQGQGSESKGKGKGKSKAPVGGGDEGGRSKKKQRVK